MGPRIRTEERRLESQTDAPRLRLQRGRPSGPKICRAVCHDILTLPVRISDNWPRLIRHVRFASAMPRQSGDVQRHSHASPVRSPTERTRPSHGRYRTGDFARRPSLHRARLADKTTERGRDAGCAGLRHHVPTSGGRSAPAAKREADRAAATRDHRHESHGNLALSGPASR
ncbi:hypothetical protein Pan189_03340 [Stratiformator vulcanicus]|uniref:Uncharacterized protein n=1 Tax=Stratiformator vulcanicus TaxID=2527980 RepID=A0A517QWD7_9PLAN|nr:hypothetical protein Pan189_03340 [Stratiformator vulcanicus]